MKPQPTLMLAQQQITEVRVIFENHLLMALSQRLAKVRHNPHVRRCWGKAFMITWLLIMLYGCVQMFRTHHSELSKFEGAGVVPGLIETEAQVLHAEHVVEG